MIAAAMMPRPGAAKGVVPKNGMGMAFCRAGVPGSADMVKVMVPRATAAGTSRRGMSAALNRPLRHGNEDEEGDEQAHAAIGDDGPGESDRQDRPRRPERLGHEAGDGFDRAAVVHQLAEQRAEQKERKELREELARRRP